ncbi:hypothetical protein FNH05_18020 [Amycolatopsis rhizosphaerae]|uniref:Uncharacterized protein n=1 Tax=Amycolatopsis rhizosphaerae TaxID=2053003 RepID=A0A558CI55_9PSEU|nr:hypothetical protein [Amycolatopsis rhizosphaerae]TVT48392.1 hypothetical protein FNH05_18020 [Amycolatopsis rhizosphaerae]
MSKLESLATAFFDHMRSHPLPEPCTVALQAMRPEVEVQIDPGPTVTHLAGLLAWAATLERIEARWGHTRYGDLHISIQGHASSGVRLRVYGGIPFDDCHGLVPLDGEGYQGVTLDELRTLRDLLQDGEAR